MQKAFGKKSVIFLFIFPAFLIYTAFVIVSIVWAGYYSFFDWSGVGEKVFVGFKNYIELLTQDAPQWKWFKAVSLKEAEKEWRKISGPALEQSRKWNQKEAVQAMDAFLNVKNPQGVKNCPLFQSPAETALKDDKTPPGSPMGGEEP